MKKLEDALSSEDAMNAPLHEIEQILEAQGREMLRAMMQTHFDLRSAQEYEALRIVAEEAARASFDEVVELIRKQSGADVPKRQVEELAIRAARDFDAFYRDRLCPPENTDHLMILSFDAKGIATLHRDLREATRKAAEATPRRLETRLVKGEKPNRKRMAEVATVYTIEQWPRTIADVLHGVHDKRDKAERRPRPTNRACGRASCTPLSVSSTTRSPRCFGGIPIAAVAGSCSLTATRISSPESGAPLGTRASRSRSSSTWCT